VQARVGWVQLRTLKELQTNDRTARESNTNKKTAPKKKKKKKKKKRKDRTIVIIRTGRWLSKKEERVRAACRPQGRMSDWGE
jgi:hypothetical protein